jgi:hypothetical protein
MDKEDNKQSNTKKRVRTENLKDEWDGSFVSATNGASTKSPS